MKKEAKKFLRKMIDNGGYIANGIYSESPKFWYSDIKMSSSIINVRLFYYLLNEKLICQDRTGRYLITQKGEQFSQPWYKKILYLNG
jgi:hypothetical protein